MKRSTFWRLYLTSFVSLAVALVWAGCARADLACPGFTMSFGSHYMTSIATTGKIRSYPIVKDDDKGTTGLTPYGKVTVTTGDHPIVVWTDRKGAMVSQDCEWQKHNP
jgi:hypothetical protein